MKFHEYRCKWWDAVSWSWREWDIFAESEAQARSVVDAESKQETRKMRPSGCRDIPETDWPDTLTIEQIQKDITLPYVTRQDLG